MVSRQSDNPGFDSGTHRDAVQHKEGQQGRGEFSPLAHVHLVSLPGEIAQLRQRKTALRAVPKDFQRSKQKLPVEAVIHPVGPDTEHSRIT